MGQIDTQVFCERQTCQANGRSSEKADEVALGQDDCTIEWFELDEPGFSGRVSKLRRDVAGHHAPRDGSVVVDHKRPTCCQLSQVSSQQRIEFESDGRLPYDRIDEHQRQVTLPPRAKPSRQL